MTGVNARLTHHNSIDFLHYHNIEAFIVDPIDQRRIIGTPITTKACHVSNLAEYTSRYGSNKKKTMLWGTVADVTETCN